MIARKKLGASGPSSMANSQSHDELIKLNDLFHTSDMQLNALLV